MSNGRGLTRWPNEGMGPPYFGYCWRGWRDGVIDTLRYGLRGLARSIPTAYGATVIGTADGCQLTCGDTCIQCFAADGQLRPGGDCYAVVWERRKPGLRRNFLGEWNLVLDTRGEDARCSPRYLTPRELLDEWVAPRIKAFCSRGISRAEPAVDSTSGLSSARRAGSPGLTENMREDHHPSEDHPS